MKHILALLITLLLSMHTYAGIIATFDHSIAVDLDTPFVNPSTDEILINNGTATLDDQGVLTVTTTGLPGVPGIDLIPRGPRQIPLRKPCKRH